MAVTIIGPTAQPYPRREYTAIVELKAVWADGWIIVPELEMVNASVSLASQGIDACTVRRRYGQVKHPWEAAFSAKVTWGDMAGWWLRISLITENGLSPVWIGQISDESRLMQGSAAHGPRGQQIYTAYGPLQILRKIAVGQSWWNTNGRANRLDWAPGMNECVDRANVTAPTERRLGNRAKDKLDGELHYLHGGDATDSDYEWTNFEYIEYLLARFCDESETDGPAWRLDGQTDVLKDLTGTVPMSETQTVADVLRKLIPREQGIDYVVFADGDGFIVWVVTLCAEGFSFGGKTLPANPNRIVIQTDQTTDCIKMEIVKSNDHGYKKVRVLGSRMVVCCSLWGVDVVDTPEGSESTLFPKWSTAQETAYENGTGVEGDPAKLHDDYRRQDKFRPVYQTFGTHRNWNFNNWTCSPVLDKAGKLTPETVAGKLTEETVDYQRAARKTLSTLPLREGFDYTTDPPVDETRSGATPVFLPPAVWVGLVASSPAFDVYVAYAPVETFNINVSALATDWGVSLSANPNHLTALNHFSSNNAATTAMPLFDYGDLVATIAFEGHYRLMLEVEMDGASPSGGVLDVKAEDAEFWYLAPNTVVGVDSAGHLQLSGTQGRVLRNDADRLELVMAGVLSRYYASRVRASITAKGLIPWPLLVGQLLTVVDTGGDTNNIPITRVAWSQAGKGGSTTILHAGFAK